MYELIQAYYRLRVPNRSILAHLVGSYFYTVFWDSVLLHVPLTPVRVL